MFDPVLPAAATNIYYVDFVGGLQDLELFVRFSVPPSEVDSAIEALIAHNNRQMGRSLAYARRPLTVAPMISPRPEFLPMAWWAPSSVASGYFRGEPTSYALQIWANSASGTIFVYQND